MICKRPSVSSARISGSPVTKGTCFLSQLDGKGIGEGYGVASFETGSVEGAPPRWFDDGEGQDTSPGILPKSIRIFDPSGAIKAVIDLAQVDG